MFSLFLFGMLEKQNYNSGLRILDSFLRKIQWFGEKIFHKEIHSRTQVFNKILFYFLQLEFKVSQGRNLSPSINLYVDPLLKSNSSRSPFYFKLDNFTQIRVMLIVGLITSKTRDMVNPTASITLSGVKFSLMQGQGQK